MELLAVFSSNEASWNELKTSGVVRFDSGIRLALTPVMREKLLAAALENPMDLAAVLPGLPETPSAVHAVRAIYDRVVAGEAAGKSHYWEQEVHDWLMLHGAFPDELRAAAQVTFAQGSFWHDDELRALAIRDWPAADGILRELLTSTDIHLVIMAKSIFYAHAVREGQPDIEARRAALKAVAEDPKAPGMARGLAFAALLADEWPSIDEWAVKMAGDSTLWHLTEEGSYSPLLDWPFAEWLVRTAPERIKGMRPLLESPDAATRKRASTMLFATRDRDAMLLLLRHPEVSGDLDWLTRLQEVRLPIQAEGLLKYDRHAPAAVRWEVARAMSTQEMPEAKLALREILEDSEFRKRVPPLMLVWELWRAEALSDTEWGWLLTGRRWPGAFQEMMERDKRLLWFLDSQNAGAREDLAAAVMEGVRRTDDPARAEAWLQMARTWPAAAVDDEVARQLVQRPLDGKLIQLALGRPKLAEREGYVLRQMVRQGGLRAAVAAAILADQPTCRSILQSGDGAAAQMLLACARVRGSALPLDAVGKLLQGPDAPLARAAEEFLVALDTPDARQLVHGLYPGKLLVIGNGRLLPESGDQQFSSIKSLVELRAEIERPEGPDEIFALCSWGGFGGDDNRVIRVRGGKATLTCHGSQPYGRELSADEMRQFRAFLAGINADELPPLSNEVFDGWVYDYMHLTRTGGHMTMIDNPGVGGTAGTPQDLLVRRFRALGFWGRPLTPP